MKFVRYGQPGLEKPAAIDAGGTLRDLSSVLQDITANDIASGRLSAITEAQLAALPAVESSARLGIPFTGTRKFLGIGLNYHDHAREIGAEIPKEPILFRKATSSLSGQNDPVERPPGSQQSEWAGERGLAIGKPVRNIAARAGTGDEFGYCRVS